jgi:hypothetical protein
MYIVMMGSVTTGVNFFGPYLDVDEANEAFKDDEGGIEVISLDRCGKHNLFSVIDKAASVLDDTANFLTCNQILPSTGGDKVADDAAGMALELKNLDQWG